MPENSNPSDSSSILASSLDSLPTPSSTNLTNAASIPAAVNLEEDKAATVFVPSEADIEADAVPSVPFVAADEPAVEGSPTATPAIVVTPSVPKTTSGQVSVASSNGDTFLSEIEGAAKKVEGIAATEAHRIVEAVEAAAAAGKKIVVELVKDLEIGFYKLVHPGSTNHQDRHQLAASNYSDAVEEAKTKLGLTNPPPDAAPEVTGSTLAGTNVIIPGEPSIGS